MDRKKKTMDKQGGTSDISTRDPQTAVEVDAKAQPEPDKKFAVVWIGASAGGLTAFDVPGAVSGRGWGQQYFKNGLGRIAPSFNHSPAQGCGSGKDGKHPASSC